MDSSADPQAFDDKKSEATPEGADAAAGAPGEAGASRAVTPFEAKAVSEPLNSDAAKPEPPQSAPVLSSALVIMPPKKDKKEKFDGSFTAGERPGGAPRARRTSWLNYLLRAAAVIIVAGGAYAAGSRYLSWPALPTPGRVPDVFLDGLIGTGGNRGCSGGAEGCADTGLADLRHENKALSDEVHKLQLRLAALQAQTPDDIRTLKKTIEGLQASLDSQQADFKVQIAQLTARLDHLHEGTRVSAATKPARPASTPKPFRRPSIGPRATKRRATRPAPSRATRRAPSGRTSSHSPPPKARAIHRNFCQTGWCAMSITASLWSKGRRARSRSCRAMFYRAPALCARSSVAAMVGSCSRAAASSITTTIKVKAEL